MDWLPLQGRHWLALNGVIFHGVSLVKQETSDSILRHGEVMRGGEGEKEGGMEGVIKGGGNERDDISRRRQEES